MRSIFYANILCQVGGIDLNSPKKKRTPRGALFRKDGCCFSAYFGDEVAVSIGAVFVEIQAFELFLLGNSEADGGLDDPE